FTEVPPIRLDRIDLMINLDMVGRNPEQPIQVLGVQSGAGPALRDMLADAGRESGLALDITDERPEDDSDHASFLARQIPTLFFFSGYHEDYHRPSDEVGKLSAPRLEAVARTVLTLTVAAADRSERLVFDPDVRPRHLGIEAGFAVADEELKAFPV